MAKSNMKRCSTLLTVREIQIKTTVRYHFILVGMTIIKKIMDKKCWQVCGERGCCCQKCKLVQSSWKRVGKFLKKLKVELSYNPEIPFLDMYSRKTKTLNLKYTCTPIFLTTLFTIAKIWKQAKYSSIDECIKMMWCVHTHTYT